MQTLEFEPEEIEILQEVARKSLKDLDIELHRTDALQAKKVVKDKKHLLESALTKLTPREAFQ